MRIHSFRIILISLMTLGLVSGAGASEQRFDDYPIYYQVQNVASNDALNVRADADAGSEIIGSLAYNAALVEVIRQEDNWGYVALNEGMGWVSMKFLRQITPAKVGQSPLPVGLWCIGNEPFWDFQLEETQIKYSHMSDGEMAFTITDANGFAGLAGQNGFVQAAASQSLFTAIFNANQCFDSMSDLEYGWQVDVVLNGESGAQGFSGCCRMRLN